MTRTLVLSMSLLAVLASALIGARLLVDAPITLPPPPPAAEPILVARPAPRPSVQPAPDRVVAPPVDRQQVETPRPPETLDDEPRAPPSELADRAIDEALALVLADQVLTPELARSTAEIFSDCLRARPLDSRCNRGLRLANRRQLRTLPIERYPARPGRPLPRAQPFADNEPE